MKDKTLFIGLGNPLRGDDGIGWALTERLRDRGFRCTQHRDDFTTLLDDFKENDRVIIVDAMCDKGLGPGESRLMEGLDLNEFSFETSTHSLSLKQIFKMAQVLDCLPSYLKVYAINGKNFKLGDEMSTELDLKEHQKRLENLCMSQA